MECSLTISEGLEWSGAEKRTERLGTEERMKEERKAREEHSTAEDSRQIGCQYEDIIIKNIFPLISWGTDFPPLFSQSTVWSFLPGNWGLLDRMNYLLLCSVLWLLTVQL